MNIPRESRAPHQEDITATADTSSAPRRRLAAPLGFLTGAPLVRANLTGSTAGGANLIGANLRGAMLTGATFTQAIWDQATTWPDGSRTSRPPVT